MHFPLEGQFDSPYFGLHFYLKKKIDLTDLFIGNNPK